MRHRRRDAFAGVQVVNCGASKWFVTLIHRKEGLAKVDVLVLRSIRGSLHHFTGIGLLHEVKKKSMSLKSLLPEHENQQHCLTYLIDFTTQVLLQLNLGEGIRCNHLEI